MIFMNSKKKSLKSLQAPLSYEIAQESNKLIKFAQLIPNQNFFDKIFNGTGSKVSVADVLAYQIGWGYLLI